ncbi:hypothetical protein P154DRAFT_461974 [Amniculicola lignicola CBS 123094]|uniref:Large ribosomal subunit protein uL23m n=1 Tax=Amniculicola lignicola CBS 123094 TaxID=1392246 RepID=A0A6A5WV54_9PLEO|nr:hypothetical protein P154DRAFT_461974 [Amniculicola lignicola CBS 123094]
MSRAFLKSVGEEQLNAFWNFRQKKLNELRQTSKLLRFGNKQIALPKFTLALIRTRHLSPYHARFQVPLNFTKYDIRDYLFHAYDIRCSNIRSFIKYSPVRDVHQAPHQFFRDADRKYMTVEMDKPFVWPEAPEDWSPWGKEEDEEEVAPKQAESGKDAMLSKGAKGKEKKIIYRALLGTQNKGMMRWKDSIPLKNKRDRFEGLREHAEMVIQGGREKWEKERTGTFGKWDKEFKVKV